MSKKILTETAIGEIGEAYELLHAFYETIQNAMEGDHPDVARVDAWLKRYETRKGWRDDSASERFRENPCKILRNAFFGKNRAEVFKALPGLPEDAFGACKCEPL